MLKSKYAAAAASVAIIMGVLAVPAVHASASPASSGLAQTTGINEIIIDHTPAGKGYGSAFTLHLNQNVSASTASKIETLLKHAASNSPMKAGPTGGEFLVCNKAHFFSDADGTFSFQHRCLGTTGPWGYRISTGVCAFVISDVHERGMAWTRNGKRQGNQSPHTVFCRYQFHGNFNPEHDFDLIAYNDIFTFRIKVGGETGTADLKIHGSFYSAECSHPIICR